MQRRFVQLRADNANATDNGGTAATHVGFTGNKVEMDPFAVGAVDNTFCTQDHTVSLGVVQLFQHAVNFVLRIFVSRLAAATCKNVVGVMMVVVLVVVVMIVMTAMFVVLMLVVMIMVTAVFVMLMVVVRMTAVFVVLMLMVVVMVTTMFVMLMVVIVMMTTMLFGGKLFEFDRHRVGVFHGGENRLAVQLVPRRRDDSCVGVLFAQKRNRRRQLFVAHTVGAAEYDRIGVLHLVVVEFTEILAVHFAFRRVGNRRKAV